MADSVRFGATGATNTDTASSPHTFPNGGAPLSVQRGVAPTVSAVAKTFAVPDAVCEVGEVQDNRVTTLSFELQNVTAPLANMLRRVMLTEVPTMAFDRVLVRENDGVVLDELLSHRIGLCPLAVDPGHFDYLSAEHVDTIDFTKPSAKHVLQFELDVAVPNDPAAPALTHVYSGHLQWKPLEGQEAMLGGVAPKLVHQDILLAKLGRGQRISLTVMAVKGLGMSHAKWAPVSACWYDMKTEVEITRPVTGADAAKLKDVCKMGVFDVEDSGAAVVKKASRCTVCRECLRPENFPDAVRVGKNKNAMKFTVESLGQYDSPEAVVRQALIIFAQRCRNLKEHVLACEVQEP